MYFRGVDVEFQVKWKSQYAKQTVATESQKSAWKALTPPSHSHLDYLILPRPYLRNHRKPSAVQQLNIPSRLGAAWWTVAHVSSCWKICCTGALRGIPQSLEDRLPFWINRKTRKKGHLPVCKFSRFFQHQFVFKFLFNLYLRYYYFEKMCSTVIPP